MRRESFDQSPEPVLERLFKKLRHAKVMRHIPTASIVVSTSAAATKASF